jgi:phenylacetate-coenzyme A ligase PaaK-like adenylate-forming protein
MVVWMSRFSGIPFPRPYFVGSAGAGLIVDWILKTKKAFGRCAVQSYVSQIVRISQNAMERGIDLDGVQFLVGSEPLSEAKSREILSSGAKVFPRYMTTELGTVGIGCGNPSEIDEYHLATDSMGVIQTRDTTGESPAQLFFTSLLPCAPKIMINVQLGDTGIFRKRKCGCLFEKMGFSTHLTRVRSLERATEEGMALRKQTLEEIIEKTLIPKYGGFSVDYQWFEKEDASSLTRLFLVIDPRVQINDEYQVVEDILIKLDAIGNDSGVTAKTWKEAGTIQILRQRPIPTSQGKHHLVFKQ